MPADLKKWGVVKLEGNQRLNPDKNYYRYGVIEAESVCKTMIETAALAKQAISKNQV